MKNPRKAKKSTRNQPTNFDETLAATMPATLIPATPALPAEPDATVATPRARALRYGLVAIWIATAIVGGVGIGLLINDATRPAVSLELPVPVATAGVAVAAVPTTTGIAPATAVVTQPGLTVQPATAISQAGAGTTIRTAALTTYQPAAGYTTLQPGFTHFGRTQGNLGTAAAR